MTTFFIIAKPFHSYCAIIHRITLRRWKFLSPAAEVILFGTGWAPLYFSPVVFSRLWR